MNETQKLASYVRGLSYGDVPQKVIKKAKELILDQFACQLAGSTLHWGRLSYEFVKKYSVEREESTVVNHGLRVTAQDAAFINGCFGHGFLGDDADTLSHGHFGSIIIPASLAIAEREKVSGKDFILAVILGYEVTARIAAAGLEAMHRGFHPGPVFGPLGAAAAAGSIIGFSEEQLVNAFGIAGSHSSGLMEYSLSGGSVNRLHSGIAAYNGIRSVLFSEMGFQGPTAIVEGNRGILRAFASPDDAPEEITKGLGEDYHVLQIGLKTHCCCGSSGTIFDALQEFRKEGVRHEDIEEIVILVGPNTFGLTGSVVEPKDVTSAQFSARFGCALALIKGSNHYKEYTEENIVDPELLALARKTQIVLDYNICDKPMTENPADVTIRFKDGAVRTKFSAAARGTILNPMDWDDVSAKFKDLASDVLSPAETDRILAMVADLDSVKDIGDLAALLVCQQ